MIVILDENLPPRWRGFLAPFDIEAIHWTNIGKNHWHQLEAGCLITLDANRHRLRLLPLH